MSKNKFSCVDLFAGCGGLSYGFHNSGYFKHLLASDIWPQAKETYELNYKNSKFVLADLSNEEELELVAKEIGKGLDILVGGPPCKGFSTLNNSKLPSKHNTLVDQYLTVVERTTPNIFLIENVRGFKSKKHPSGVTYPEHVQSRVSGFRTKYLTFDFVLNTSDYGIAQNRIRYFMIGVKISFDPKKQVTKKIQELLEAKKTKRKIVLKDVISDLPKVKVRGGSDLIELEDGRIIYNHKSMNHSEELERKFKHVPKNGGLMDVPYKLLTDHLKKVVDGKYGSGGFAKNIYGRMDWDKPSGTVVAGMDKITIGRFVHPEEDRLLTPRECARIQSFPDNFVFTGGMVSQYYQIGNAVPPKISKIFAEVFAEALQFSSIAVKRELVWS